MVYEVFQIKTPLPQIEKKMSLTSINGKIFQWKKGTSTNTLYMKNMHKV
jgi:hypothetical protein